MTTIPAQTPAIIPATVESEHHFRELFEGVL